ncbi:MAG: DivIVA domain-containing protein [Lachnospiraceae bacterium]|nr:DivIVA domain-containing protein [Lachnospiraceae bacterium]
MASSIEQIIEDMERFIDSEGKPAAFSSTKIVISRDELEGFLEELKVTTPDEIKRYQKIVSQREAIIADANAKAEKIISQAQIKTDELVSEHEIMQQAYAQANQVVMIATKDAQEMLDKATREANEIKTGAIQYTDDLLASVQEVLANSIDVTRRRDEAFIGKLSGILDRVSANRSELRPEEDIAEPVTENKNEEVKKDEKAKNVEKAGEPKSTPKEISKEDGEVATIDVPEEFFKHD